eukprot:1149407-Pelagomonas_calceolata.AAC.4
MVAIHAHFVYLWGVHLNRRWEVLSGVPHKGQREGPALESAAPNLCLLCTLFNFVAQQARKCLKEDFLPVLAECQLWQDPMLLLEGQEHLTFVSDDAIVSVDESYKGYKGYKEERPQSRRLTASLITDITDRRSTIGPSRSFNSESVYPQPESGNVAKEVMGKFQVHVFRQSIRRVNGMCISDRKRAPLMICQPFTVVHSRIRGCELIPVAKVPRCDRYDQGGLQDEKHA